MMIHYSLLVVVDVIKLLRKHFLFLTDMPDLKLLEEFKHDSYSTT